MTGSSNPARKSGAVGTEADRERLDIGADDRADMPTAPATGVGREWALPAGCRRRPGQRGQRLHGRLTIPRAAEGAPQGAPALRCSAAPRGPLRPADGTDVEREDPGPEGARRARVRDIGPVARPLQRASLSGRPTSRSRPSPTGLRPHVPRSTSSGWSTSRRSAQAPFRSAHRRQPTTSQRHESHAPSCPAGAQCAKGSRPTTG